MARIRTIKPETWTSEQVMNLTPLARLAFIGLWNFCDDGGIHPASARTLKAEVFPSDEIPTPAVESLVAEMLDQGLLASYEANGKSYWNVTGWKRHQRIDKPTFKHPPPTEMTASDRGVGEPKSANGRQQDAAPSTSQRQVLAENSSNAPPARDEASPPDRKGMEGIGKEGLGYSALRAGAVRAEKSETDLDGLVGLAAALNAGVVDRPKDDMRVLWQGGKAVLALDAGMTIKAAGDVIGTLRRDYGDEVLCDTLQRVCAERPAGPVPWMKRMCQLSVGEVSKTNKQGRLEAANDAAAKAFVTGDTSYVIDNAQTRLEASNDAAVQEFLKGDAT